MFKGNYYDFIEALGQRESNNNYSCVNQFGFMGRWQFGKPRLYDLGYSIDGWTPSGRKPKPFLAKSEFLKSKSLQNALMLKHVDSLKTVIQKRYADTLGTEINGIKVTISGLVAGAHLKGLGGVKQFLKGKDNEDALGTKISEYISKFGDYDLDVFNEFNIKDEIAKADALAQPKPPDKIERA